MIYKGSLVKGSRDQGVPLKGSIRVPLKGSIRVPLNGSVRVPLNRSVRVPSKGSVRLPVQGSVGGSGVGTQAFRHLWFGV